MTIGHCVFQDGGHRRTRRRKSAKKCIFWKMFAIYKILHISLDSGRDLEQFEVHVL